MEANHHSGLRVFRVCMCASACNPVPIPRTHTPRRAASRAPPRASSSDYRSRSSASPGTRRSAEPDTPSLGRKRRGEREWSTTSECLVAFAPIPSAATKALPPRPTDAAAVLTSRPSYIVLGLRHYI